MKKPITIFTGHHRFLSNFASVEVVLDGEIYPSVEHAYQAAKTECVHSRKRIRTASTPGQAKRLGKHVPIRSDWTEAKRLSVMEELLRQKFAKDRYKMLLKNTGDAELIEGNTWGDCFWGVCQAQGRNNLGKLIMKIRAEMCESQS